jgi:1,4-dihydroxy-2-naphthoate octaprenyltransferase
MFVATALGIAYSLPPLRTSARPFWSIGFWFLFGAVCYLSVASLANRMYTISSLLYLLATTIFMGIGETLAKDIRDWDNDRAGAKVTAVVFLGPAISVRISYLAAILGLATYCTLMWLDEQVGWTAAALGTLLGSIWLLCRSSEMRRLSLFYDKRAAIALHRSYLLGYSTLNLIISGSLILHRA